jgi:hypothetical protein
MEILGAIIVLIGGLLLVAGMIGGAYLLNGWAILMLWGWFVVPLGVVPIHMAWAIGLAVLMSMFGQAPPIAKKSDKGDEKTSSALMILFLRPLLAVFVGWLCHLAMQ